MNREDGEETIMAYETIEVRKTTPVIGAEIFGVDLSQQLSNRQFEEIHQALPENLVIFFRDQKLSVEQHKTFGARFGKLQWQKNSIAFWDNRCAQHQAIFDYWPHKRYGHRVTICGDKPFGIAERIANARRAAV
jgi:alpha-ketoglutarate-dependent taurine dioxygenase